MSESYPDWKVLRQFPDHALEQAWREFLQEADYPSGMVLPEYLPRNAPDGRFAILAMVRQQVIGVLTGMLSPTRSVSGMAVRPQVCCRHSADSKVVALVLAAGLESLTGGLELVTLHTWAEMKGFESMGYRVRPARGEQGLIVLDLTEGTTRLFSGLSPSRRNEVRKAIKLGVEVVVPKTRDELEQFYGILVDWCARKKLAPLSFEACLRSFAADRLTLLAKLEQRVLAASVFRSCPGGIVEYTSNFSSPESWAYKPNELLLWRGIEWAEREGHRLFSFGTAHSFVQRYGGRALTTYRYQIDRTLFRRHEMRERLVSLRARMARPLPSGTKTFLKHLLGLRPT